MELKNYNVYFFFLVLAAVTVVAYFIFKPFLTAIIAAAILAVIFQRPYKYLLRVTRDRRSLSAILATILVVLVILIPFMLVGGLIFSEIAGLVKAVSSESSQYTVKINNFIKFFTSLPLIQSFNVETFLEQEEVVNSVKKVSQATLSILQRTYQGVIHYVFTFFIMLFTLYYLFIDGGRVVQKIISLSPLRDKHEKLLIEKFVSTSRATIKGTLVVGVIQGILGGIAFAIVGIPSPVIWAVIMTIFSIIPVAGSGFVWVPVGTVMLVTGNIWGGIFILAFGILVIANIDNVLRPKLVGKDTAMHPLIVFFSTLGGMALIGISGFIIGPIIAAFFLTLWEIYSAEFREQLGTYNR
jgi:predicted PurR-regulated permease PerM